MRRRSVKMDRINADVQRTLSEIIRNEVKDPRVGPMTSITSVDVAKDLKTAKIYISVLGDEGALSGTMEGLESSSGFIRGRLARELNLRNTPELRFIADSSIAYGMKMSQMIDQVIANDQQRMIEEDREEEERDGNDDSEF